jgi:ATP synthase subunit G
MASTSFGFQRWRFIPLFGVAWAVVGSTTTFSPLFFPLHCHATIAVQLFKNLLLWTSFAIVANFRQHVNLLGLTGRGDRMKQAKADAQELIDAYRAEKQEEFNNMVLSKGGSEGSASAKLQADTNKEIADMQAQFQKNAQKAVDVLLSKCCEVSLEVPTARVRATQKLAGVAS